MNKIIALVTFFVCLVGVLLAVNAAEAATSRSGLRAVIVAAIGECHQATPTGDREALRACFKSRIFAAIVARKQLTVPMPTPPVPAIETPKPSDITVDANRVAACLTEANAVLYGADSCPHCRNQKALFGNSFSQIAYVECEQEPAVCQKEDIEGYPTWKIGDQVLLGTQPLSELAKATGCDAASPTPVPARPRAQAGELCGGIAGIMCADGLSCVMNGTYPDASGICRE